jgi:hypothetical protein
VIIACLKILDEMRWKVQDKTLLAWEQFLGLKEWSGCCCSNQSEPFLRFSRHSLSEQPPRHSEHIRLQLHVALLLGSAVIGSW